MVLLKISINAVFLYVLYSIQIHQSAAVDCIIREGNVTRGHVQCDTGCCGFNGCCVHYYIYQIWYFWLCIFVALSLCSATGRYYYRHKYIHQRVIVRPIEDRNIQNMTSAAVDATNEYATAGSSTDCFTSDTSRSYSETEDRKSARNIGNRLAPPGTMISIIGPPSYTDSPPSYESIYVTRSTLTTNNLNQAQNADEDRGTAEAHNNSYVQSSRGNAYMFTTTIADNRTSDFVLL